MNEWILYHCSSLVLTTIFFSSRTFVIIVVTVSFAFLLRVQGVVVTSAPRGIELAVQFLLLLGHLIILGLLWTIKGVPLANTNTPVLWLYRVLQKTLHHKYLDISTQVKYSKTKPLHIDNWTTPVVKDILTVVWLMPSEIITCRYVWSGRVRMYVCSTMLLCIWTFKGTSIQHLWRPQVDPWPPWAKEALENSSALETLLIFWGYAMSTSK